MRLAKSQAHQLFPGFFGPGALDKSVVSCYHMTEKANLVIILAGVRSCICGKAAEMRFFISCSVSLL